MVITYSGRSAPSAFLISECDEDIQLNRGWNGDINWGRNKANTQLNPDISNVTNKRVMRELFASHSVPMPYLYRNTWDMEFPVVGRPDQHSKGRGLWICYGQKDVQRALKGTRRKAAATHFMEYVDAPYEYRVHIFNGKSIRISQKAFTDETKKEYTTAKPQRPVAHVREAAKKAVAAVGLDFGAVDILASDEECWVLEVNAAPGLGGSMPRVYAEAFRKWYENE